MARRTGALGRLTAGLIAATAAGCIPLPVPYRPLEIGPVPDQIVAQIRSGTSTRADVLLLLGDPIVRAADDAYFVYTWAYRRGGVSVIGLTGGGPMPGLDVQEYVCRALAIHFTDTGGVGRAATFEGTTRSVSSVMDFDVSTSLSALCRQDAELIARIRAWAAAPATAEDSSPPVKATPP